MYKGIYEFHLMFFTPNLKISLNIIIYLNYYVSWDIRKL